MTTYAVQLTPEKAKYGLQFVWEWPVRVTHWVTAVAIVLLFATGLFIASPVFSSQGEAFDNFTMGRFRQLHFLAGYALLFSFLLRGYWFFAGNKYSRSGVPLIWQRHWWENLWEQVREYMGTVPGPLRLGHTSLAGLSYFLMVGMLGLFQIVTGFALYGESNPGGFWDNTCGFVIPMLGGSFRTHMWHHAVAWGFVVFVILHLYIVIFDSIRYKNGLLASIVTGSKYYKQGDIDTNDWVS
ncbi:MAG: Ni/Fe-hydrogenase, b-type cytochrome subunit [Bryobacteraceae bacterium]